MLASEELDFAVHDDLEDREEAEAAPDVSHDPRLTPDVLLQQIQARRALVEAEGPALAAVAAAVVARFATVLERNHGWTREESIRAAIRVGASLI